MTTTSTTLRTTKGREWEKERRNKFNQAIIRLGEQVKLASTEQLEKEVSQLSKIEIVQRAIKIITDFIEEKSRLKAEILALEVKFNSSGKICNKQDSATQVKIRNKLVKKKIKKPFKVPTTSNEVLKPAKIMPKILPDDKKIPKNTLVVLPATPYMIPQRPLLLPPTFVVLNPSIQTVNKIPLQRLNRNTKDITKTTMVNMMPISAYSHPMSASKAKKQKSETKKKIIKKNTSKEDCSDPIKAKTNELNSDSKENKINKEKQPEKENQINTASAITSVDVKVSSASNKTDKDKDVTNNNPVKCSTSQNVQVCKTVDSSIKDSTKTSLTTEGSTVNTTIAKALISDKQDMSNSKQKITNILDSALCENAVDGGNTGLELAEELIAASPTAAFLMSFPLVSGNRADSPAEENNQITTSNTPKDDNKRSEVPLLDKSHVDSVKDKNDKQVSLATESIVGNANKLTIPSTLKFDVSNTKKCDTKTTTSSTSASVPSFLNLQMAPVISTTCSLSSDPTYSLDFDVNINKCITSQNTSYAASSGLFYKNDTFGSMKNSIYSTSSISSGHDFNNLGLYPCAMEKYVTKSKSDYPNVEDNLMKLGSSLLTYDNDLSWTHKGLDFVTCTTTGATFTKDNLLTTMSSSYSTSYNPFNTEFRVPLVNNNSKKDHTNKTNTSLSENIPSYYSQSTSLWSEENPFYANNTSTPTFTSKSNTYLPFQSKSVSGTKQGNIKHDGKDHTSNSNVKSSINATNHHVNDKYTKKSPNKMHINWMTSEVRPAQNYSTQHNEIKDNNKTSSYTQFDQNSKRQDIYDNNYFPIGVYNYTSQTSQDEVQMWPSSRPLGTAEINLEPPPISLPILVGDLALGPHDKKKTSDINRGATQSDLQNFNNFSVTQIMNSSVDNNRFNMTNNQHSSKVTSKQNVPTNDNIFKTPVVDSNFGHPYYSYETNNSFTTSKSKSSKVSDKSNKQQKNSYSAEALIRGNHCTQKITDNKFPVSMQKYSEYHPQQDNSVAQVSHFPPIIDYSENNYAGQQLSGTTFYNSTTNTISNSFYSNFMSGNTNLMPSNYSGTPFSEFIDYNQVSECNYPANQKYEELKMKNSATFHYEKNAASTHKPSKREQSSKHKLECSKKDSSKRYNKKAKLANAETEEWSDNNLLWQNKNFPKRHTNLVNEELPFTNYVGNQMASQYQSDIFNSHIMPPNVQSVGHNIDRALTGYSGTSQTNFNLSTIFPEITMKIQS